MTENRLWEYPEDNPYGECTYDGKVEVYFNICNLLTDAELNQVWDIVGKACDRNNIDTSGDAELSVRVYNEVNVDLINT